MCGIVAYLGNGQAREVMLVGLARLEYRGYDSAGLAIMQTEAQPAAAASAPPQPAGVITSNGMNGAPVPPMKRVRTPTGPVSKIKVVKTVGKVSALAAACGLGETTAGTLGIAHTRWATHGAPSDANAHPHLSADCTLAVVHNGIVENFVALREELCRKGYTMRSETDTELIAHLIADVRKQKWMPLEEAVRQALTQIHGAFGIAVISSDEPDLLVGARKGSPLILGIGDDEYLLASDASAVVERTRRVTYLKDGEMVVVTRNRGYEIKTLDNVKLIREVEELQMKLEDIQKGSFKHFMLKEICEQPEVLENGMRGRVLVAEGDVLLGGLTAHIAKLASAPRIIIVGCGTSHNAGLIGEYLLETLARIPTEVEYASEFRYRTPILFAEDVVIAISQSGETADTLAALQLARAAGCLCLGICNTVGSSIARETHAGIYLHAGPEIGVASTKAFSAQLLALSMLALKLGKERGEIDSAQMTAHLTAMSAIPDQLRTVLQQKEKVFEMAKVFKYASNFLYLGRGYHYPVALEGALKLKEISYIHAEGYPAAEMKHGPIALIDEFMPVVIIAPRSDPNYRKLVSNIEEVRARGGSVIAITESDNDELDERCEYVIRVPSTSDFLTPLLCVLPLQLMAYYIADMRKCNVDQPRNLAKSVTVE